jgi:hypothetical protein
MLSLFQSLSGVIGKFLTETFNNLTRELFKVRHLLVGIVALALAPINMGLNLVTNLLQQIIAALTNLSDQILALGIQSAPGWWASAGTIVGQLNAVVPVDYCLSVGAVVAACWLSIQTVRLCVWLYSLIPFKLT